VKPSLREYQRKFALHRVAFSDLLSQDVAEALHRASLASFENDKKEIGIIGFLCALYIHDQTEVTRYIRGDFSAVLAQHMPKHRFGKEGLVPQAMLEKMGSEGDSCESVFYPFAYDDELLHLLWVAARIANAVGKRASIRDVIVALTLDSDWAGELKRNGLEPSNNLADFDKDVRTVVFHAAQHSSEHWPRHMTFEHEESIRPPFTLEIVTPSARFQPVRSAKVRLNGVEVAQVSWPENPSTRAEVQLRQSNDIDFELNGPQFSSVDVTIRGILGVKLSTPIDGE
jgi:hypothetical protein